ncbi:MAG TPA: hypothetical protein VMU93_06615 [Caulobacteraceae bacterium]|nr:hypothetical protein [Caulobacteraceae bacterium]
MRLPLALALVALPVAAAAGPAAAHPDRYGPSAVADPGASAVSGPEVYHGRFLDWPDKRAPVQASAVRPERRAASPAPAAPLPAAVEPDRANPAASPTASAQPPPALAPPPAAPATRALAQAAPPAADPDHTGVRYYSLLRPYGLTPDPIPMPKHRPMVLIGPPDASASAASGDGGDAAGKAGAAGADGKAAPATVF